MARLSCAASAGAALNRHCSPPTLVSAVPPERVKNRTAGRRSGSRRDPDDAPLPVLGFAAPAAPSGQNPKMLASNTFWLPQVGNAGFAKPTARQADRPLSPPATLMNRSMLPHRLPNVMPCSATVTPIEWATMLTRGLPLYAFTA